MVVMDNKKRKWLIQLKGEEGCYFYYPDDRKYFVGNDLDVHKESEKRANEWEQKTGQWCFGILCESHGVIESLN